MLLCVLGYAQELPTITPPSPSAYELGKYGAVSVGMYTGTVQPNVPLLVYQTKNLKVPISLSYNSNGIKVDQMTSNVGLGWSLNAGGVITKITQGEPNNALPSIDDENPFSALMNNYFYTAVSHQYSTGFDKYSYNFMGNTGTFVFDKNGGIVFNAS